MTNQSPSQKSFVKSGNEATIVCPECGRAKDINVRQFLHQMHMVKVECKCGYSFKVELEFRRHYRKPTNLPGTYNPLPPAIAGGKIKVVNLSLSGACFEMHGTHDLKIGQIGDLVFTLDNRKETILTKSLVIKSVTGNRIGGEFMEDRAFEKDLGFYLRS